MNQLKSYIAFLRGVNVGGHNKLKMSDLKIGLSILGYKNIATYIQSGNVFFKSENEDKLHLQDEIESFIFQKFGYEIPVLIKTGEELQHILDNNPFANAIYQKNLYFALLAKPPGMAEKRNFVKLKFENEEFFVTDQCVYLNCHLGAGKAKLTNNVIEKELKIRATTRNLNTMDKMIALSQNS
ncbi:MAG: DUF1697 domain-containing protein [Croceitalea sp.]|nr:DUF1697 domain-containing protein [Croceitalea sp.]MBT8238297.1 DUF1697 domain-containing protein [Croceitalea sp.]NNL08774.1 DUF1697 domain-containing protein [Croceitalea sp.]NNM19597.1 DUF1697 domain-containing protein [Croceitalea sp.]